jgi:pantoate--beta-alanine ligase
MGALHEGHLSLIRRSAAETGFTVASVYVNPTQFGPAEDFRKYPRDLDSDVRLASSAGADIVFAPGDSDMYPEGYATYVAVERLTETLCGKSRPTHFRGVTTVVAKLFDIVNPHAAFFGRKDAQQLAVIRRMARDLNMPVDIVGCPIVRESDGLAMSSRNRYLSPEERAQATVLRRALLAAKEAAGKGESNAAELLKPVREILSESPLFRLDYAEIVDPDEMTAVSEVRDRAMLALAGWFGSTRLIDNIMLTEKEG